ncbi:hypothetical protein BKA70DRAFT_1426611 [Coprinopsis sp. MPI-PUGE-AT-0042]|nr:hypothetical protein BKA70DRAFT_1426611 [Coprinopsis sp. MPI-PUGE-AT-0042]
MPKASKSSKKADVPFGPPVPYERPTTHPLLTTTSHRATASALQAAAVHQANAVHPREATTWKEKAAWMSRLVAELKAYPSAYAPLVAAGTEEVDEKLREALDSFFLVSPHSPPPVPRWNYVSWLIDAICNKDHKFAGILPAAYKERQQNLLYYRALRKKVMSEWLLFKTVEAYKNFHSLVFHYRIKRRLPGGESPQVGKWVAEWPGVAKAARKLFAKMPLADRRRLKGRKPEVGELDDGGLSWIIPEDLNVVLIDDETDDVVLSVVRNFSNSPAMLSWVKGVVSEAVASRRSVRREDSGQLVQIGWSGRARNKPIFSYARNLLRKVADICKVVQQNAIASAYMWRRVQLMHPPVVGADISEFFHSHNIPMLDDQWPESARTHGPVMYPASAEPITIQEAEFGPGCVIMSENYTRIVHREAHPTEYGVFWTTLREGSNPRGNHFYLASYGVCVRSAEDTSVAWRPSDYHTSSIGNWDLPASFKRNLSDPTMRQQGIAFVASNRIATVYRRWAARQDLTGKQRFEGAQADFLADTCLDDLLHTNSWASGGGSSDSEVQQFIAMTNAGGGTGAFNNIAWYWSRKKGGDWKPKQYRGSNSNAGSAAQLRSSQFRLLYLIGNQNLMHEDCTMTSMVHGVHIHHLADSPVEALPCTRIEKRILCVHLPPSTKSSFHALSLDYEWKQQHYSMDTVDFPSYMGPAFGAYLQYPRLHPTSQLGLIIFAPTNLTGSMDAYTFYATKPSQSSLSSPSIAEWIEKDGRWNAKKGIREALADAQAYWQIKVLKRPRSPELEMEMGGRTPIQTVNERSEQPLIDGASTSSEQSTPHCEELLGQQGDRRGRPRRRRFPTPRYRESSSPNCSPSPLPSVTEDVEMQDYRRNPSSTAPSLTPPSNSLPELVQPEHAATPSTWCTTPDSWGLSRLFFGCPPPSHDPGGIQEEEEAPRQEGGFTANTKTPPEATQPTFFPYPNRSSFELGDWWSKQVSKRSASGFAELLTILNHPNFSRDELVEANWPIINERLSHGAATLADTPPSDSEWVDDTGGDWAATRIELPIPFSTGGKGSRILEFSAGTLHHRSILSVIKERMSNPTEHAYRHIRPYQLLWNVPDTPEGIRVYGELYTSDEFLRLEKAVQSTVVPDESDRALERVIVAMMFWTDATLLANFGTAKLWPCYLFFGNDSKYRRAKMSLDLCNHIAYFENLHDDFKDWYREHSNGKNPSQDLVTHCARELFHHQWRILMDAELLRAMEFGIKILFPDGVFRLVFPRLFTYSADYPEKVLIATVKAGGLCPCPRCMIEKCNLDPFGRREDQATRESNVRVDSNARQGLVQSARKFIYQGGYAVKYKKVEDLLKTTSLVPTENAFSVLKPFGFDVFSSLVVDLMHEFELGVWKALFIHLIRMLEAHDKQTRSTSVSELDRRYRSMPGFGSDTIRTLSSNASEQKRLGARDYENLLQCSYAAFDGLLPEPHNRNVTTLLFCCAEWHALAKLRMHTEETLLLLDLQTAALATNLETFMRDSCESFDTRETHKEQRARLKRSAKQASADAPQSIPSEAAQANPPSTSPFLQATNTVAQSDRRDPKNSMSAPLNKQGNNIPVPILQETIASDIHQSHVPLPLAEDLGVPQPPSHFPPRTGTGKNDSCATGRLKKKLNIATYKYHALADYTASIRQYGTTDSYSSERGEVEHKLPKSWYPRTDKKGYRMQMAKIERRRASHRRIRQLVKPLKSARKRRTGPPMKEPYALASSENLSEPTNHFIPSFANLHDPALLKT